LETDVNKYCCVTAGSMQVGKWYKQTFRSTGMEMYFYAESVQKNGGFAGYMWNHDTSRRATPKPKKESCRRVSKLSGSPSTRTMCLR